jgi:MFS family permease
MRPSPAYARYVLGLLFVVYVFNFIDRQVLAILIGPIQEELGISDAWMGTLAGFAFAVFYTLAGIPIARLADTRSRTAVITFSLTLWSLMTAASGLARNFVHLALARVAVGVGEAGGTPPSHSLLSDYFRPERRATALALYGNGIYVGSGLGYMAGGWIVMHFDWRTAFLVTGLAGLPLALLVRLTVRELPRGSSEALPGGQHPVAAADAESAGFAHTFRYLFSQPAFLWLVVGACFQAVAGYGILIWGGEFFARVHSWDRAQIGMGLGATVMFAGCAGVSLGGMLADRLGARDPAWYMRLPAVVCLVGVPFGVGFVLLGSPGAALASFVPFYFVVNMYVGPLWSTTQTLARPDMRATASALLLFILNMVGLGAGPFVVGVLNDVLAPSQGGEAIRTSLLIIVALGALAAPFFWLSSAHLGRARPVRPGTAGDVRPGDGP